MQSRLESVMHKSKADIRKEVRVRKQALSPLSISTASREMCSKLEVSSLLREAEVIVAFWPMKDEIDIKEYLIKEETLGEKKIYLPVITGDGIMEFRLFEGEDNMVQELQFGIWEPISKEVLLPDEAGSKKVAIIVPGVAFTERGDRLGRGRGFYDRILCTFEGAATIGVCYKCQMYDEIPIDPHDRPIDVVYFT